MKKLAVLVLAALTIAMVSLEADAARRFGGGGNLGRQRPAPTAREATPPAATAPAPTQAAPGATATSPSAATAPGAIAPRPSFMGRWGGLLAGLGIGAVLASLFGAQMGPVVGLLLMGLLVMGALMLLMRFLTGRREPQPAPAAGPARFMGFDPPVRDAPIPTIPPIGSRVASAPDAGPAREPVVPPGFDVAAFERVGKTAFIRMQDANDRGDLDDIRDFTTPQMYAEIAMQVKERGGVVQRTEIVSLEARVVEAVVEADYEIASVRFWGLIREESGASPMPFDETWHVQKKARDPKATWLVAGIQQND